jgi:hypothetical protein
MARPATALPRQLAVSGLLPPGTTVAYIRDDDPRTRLDDRGWDCGSGRFGRFLGLLPRSQRPGRTWWWWLGWHHARVWLRRHGCRRRRERRHWGHRHRGYVRHRRYERDRRIWSWWSADGGKRRRRSPRDGWSRHGRRRDRRSGHRWRRDRRPRHGWRRDGWPRHGWRRDGRWPGTQGRVHHRQRLSTLFGLLQLPCPARGRAESARLSDPLHPEQMLGTATAPGRSGLCCRTMCRWLQLRPIARDLRHPDTGVSQGRGARHQSQRDLLRGWLRRPIPVSQRRQLRCLRSIGHGVHYPANPDRHPASLRDDTDGMRKSCDLRLSGTHNLRVAV